MVQVKFLSKLKENTSVGLDIGTSSAKFLKLKNSNGSMELCACKRVPLGADTEEPLKKLIQEQEVRKANISVCGPAAIIRYAQFPRMNEDEFKQALRFEAQKHLPFSISEINLDGAILTDLPDNKMLVLLAAVKKDFLSARLKLMDKLGISVGAVEIDSTALINAFNFNQRQDEALKGKTVALLDIGAAYTNLNILEAGAPRLSRDIQLGGNNFTQKLSELLGINLKTAEELKINPPQDKTEVVARGVDAVLAGLAGEIRVSFDYYESQSSFSVGKIFLSGAASLMPGLKESLGGLLGIQVETWDPFAKVNIPQELASSDEFKNSAAAYAVAFGLALHF